MLKAQTVPRVRVKEMWRVPEPYLEQAQDDATLIAIRDMERAGIDIITDGEMRRESYSNRFATALEGIDVDTPAVVKNRASVDTVMPRVVGKVRRASAVEVRDMEFLRRNTERKAKITLPGPFTMTQQAKNEFYKDQDELAMDFAVAVNEEARALQAAGADVIQLDEPWLRNDPEGAKRYAIKAINRALDGITVPTVIHLCFGYASWSATSRPPISSLGARGLEGAADLDRIRAAEHRSRRAERFVVKEDHAGVINLGDQIVERPEQVAERIRAGLKHVSPDRLFPAPDCGMKYLSREVAFGKLKALADGAAIVRKEIS